MPALSAGESWLATSLAQTIWKASTTADINISKVETAVACPYPVGPSKRATTILLAKFIALTSPELASSVMLPLTIWRRKVVRVAAGAPGSDSRDGFPATVFMVLLNMDPANQDDQN